MFIECTTPIEKDLWATSTISEDYLKALNVTFGNFSGLGTT